MQGVPGFYQDDAGRWTINFGSRTAGILLPAVGMDGLICGMQIRLDTSLRRRDDPPGKSGAKYIWLSSVGSQDTTQEVEIYFNFVGRYIPPALQPVPLTPEEQEELRKKEERKDRLHQNYLRRKANGKQKEWEERYNAERKAKMEAAKAAIRAEDMEKGIFTTVSQLPRQEPRKATVSASATV